MMVLVGSHIQEPHYLAEFILHLTIQYSPCKGRDDNVLLVVVSWVVVMINKMAPGSSSQLTDCIDLWPRQFNSYVMFLGGTNWASN